mmetsp:Transcript_45349/g.117385  ORF Transcript_45349/g.117385 Transcript_45349/m.117385 type:complete len:289 (-) Transcript_45349:736-1602(-)
MPRGTQTSKRRRSSPHAALPTSLKASNRNEEEVEGLLSIKKLSLGKDKRKSIESPAVLKDVSSSLPRLPIPRGAAYSTTRCPEGLHAPAPPPQHGKVRERAGFSASRTTKLIQRLLQEKCQTGALTARNFRVHGGGFDLSVKGESASVTRGVFRNDSSTSLLSAGDGEFSDDDELEVISGRCSTRLSGGEQSEEEDDEERERARSGMRPSSEDEVAKKDGARTISRGRQSMKASPVEEAAASSVGRQVESSIPSGVYDTTFLPKEVAESLPSISYRDSKGKNCSVSMR